MQRERQCYQSVHRDNRVEEFQFSNAEGNVNLFINTNDLITAIEKATNRNLGLRGLIADPSNTSICSVDCIHTDCVHNLVHSKVQEFECNIKFLSIGEGGRCLNQQLISEGEEKKNGKSIDSAR